MNNTVGQVVTVLTAIVGVALVATLVSKNAQTPAVIKEAGDFFTGAIKAATGPVSGGYSGFGIG